jgi:hypothetical protein
MIDLSFSEFDDSSVEGKLLLSTLAILTTVSHQDIDSGKYTNPHTAFQHVVDLANQIYFEKDYKNYRESIIRDRRISQILNSTDDTK